MLNTRSLALIFVLLVSLITPAIAVNPDEVLSDPALEERARELSVQIRCLVCQNQSIDDSDAQLARDLRVLVREKLVEGLDDDQILEFLVARYGEFVLLKPRINARTIVLWALPFALLMVAGFFLLRRSRRDVSQITTQSGLSEQEEEQLNKLLGSKEDRI